MAFPLSDGGFAPTSWGPHAWAMIHLVAASYPTAPTTRDKRAYEAFYRSLGDVLPCPGCRAGYAHLLNDTTPLRPEVFADRMSLFKWTVDLHNAVNAKLGKPIDRDVTGWYIKYDKIRS
jgi:FAD-linked sulfhydryl oxidase